MTPSPDRLHHLRRYSAKIVSRAKEGKLSFPEVLDDLLAISITVKDIDEKLAAL